MEIRTHNWLTTAPARSMINSSPLALNPSSAIFSAYARRKRLYSSPVPPRITAAWSLVSRCPRLSADSHHSGLSAISPAAGNSLSDASMDEMTPR